MKAMKQKSNDEEMLCYGRIFIHYCFHHFFLEKNQILDNISKISHISATIVQGRHDIITRPEVAYELHKNWPNSKMIFAEGGGHSSFDDTVTAALIEATNKYSKMQYNKLKVSLLEANP